MTEPLGNLLKSLPAIQDAKAEAFLTDFLSAAPSFKPSPDVAALMKMVFVYAPFLRDAMSGDEVFFVDALKADIKETLQKLIAHTSSLANQAESENVLMREIRICKRRVALLLALADLGKVLPCIEVVTLLSDFADAALLSAVRFSLREEAKRGKITIKNHEEPERGSGLIILAMGKHGAGELNYSSDIDSVVFYDPRRIKCADQHDLQPAMVRITRRLVKIMQERTEHGYVFRTDLRLRPDPGATAIAISVDAALNYYESIGQNWERAAFIKARPVACDFEAANAFLAELSPFIWRKYMDFAMIADVHAMKRQIHQHKGHGAIAIRGHNIKLGRGGIREIEFFVQTQQLIAGGRNPELRGRQTMMMLPQLAQAGWITQETAKELQQHYIFLRNIEHRIQMRHDEQTHILPADTEGFNAVAHMMGYVQVADFEHDLRRCLERVSYHYGKLFEDDQPEAAQKNLSFSHDQDHPDTLQALSQMGFENVKQVASLIRGWHQGLYRAVRTKRAQATLQQMQTKLLHAFSRTTQPDQALYAFDQFLKSLPAGIQLFSLLKQNDHLLDLMAQLMGSAPRLSETIARRPHVFDALLEPAFFNMVPDIDQICQQLHVTLREAVDYEDILDRVRIFTQEQKFLIGTRLLSGTVTVSESQALYSDLADSVAQALLAAVIKEVARVHGQVADSDVSILAMGKWGGREMTPTSDLDMILIYQAKNLSGQSDGARPLAVSQYFSRITQRLIAAFSASTGEGIAYSVDMRLRPSGKSGPLATELQSFTTYQRDNAWTWEHMALTRARPLGGQPALQTAIRKTISALLCQPRDNSRLQNDVWDMNARLHAAKKTQSFWELKEAPGGLVDVEFLAQFFQLAHAETFNDILAVNTEAALAAACRHGVLSSNDFRQLGDALSLYTGLIQILRLCVETNFSVETAPRALLDRLIRQAGVSNKNELEFLIAETQQSVQVLLRKYLAQAEMV